VLNRFFFDENGATAIEYAIIATLIAVVVIVAITVVGQEMNQTFWRVNIAMWGGEPN